MPIQSSLLSKAGAGAGPSSASSSLAKFLPAWFTSSSPTTRKAIYGAVLAGILSAAVVPSLLPSRVSFFGIPPLSNVFSNFSTSVEHKKALKRKGLEKWMESEREFAWERLLKNINLPGTDPGCVVASPSKQDPDYYYQWTRDSAMVFKVIIEYWRRSKDTHPGQAEKLIFDFIAETKKMQRMDTPSGGFRTGGLGEVKFHVDGTPFMGSWGRPQYDGPALRASALFEFANILLDLDSKQWEPYVRRELWDSSAFGESETVIKADLDFVCDVWHKVCHDLWEEVSGLHHFNMLITIRALLDGAKFATRLGDTASAKKYSETAEEVQAFLTKFWSEDKKYILATIEFENDHGKISWLDTGTVLGFLHSGNMNRLINNGDDKNEEYLGSDKSLVTQMEIANSMRDEYSLNKRYYPASGKNKALGFAVGRYYEDVYDGDGVRKTGRANPWYLCILAHAEFYYRLIHYFRTKTIEITELNKPFYLELGYFDEKSSAVQELMVGQKYAPGSTEHDGLLLAFRDKGDAFVRVVRDFAKWNGGLWEQFDRDNGIEMGAPHLTWSYASFLSCMEARNGRPMFD